MTSTPTPDDAALLDALQESQRVGMLGARPLPEVVAHARHFVRALAPVTGSAIDLGTGGGVPGLVLAWDRPDLRVVLLDRRAKRTDLLQRLVGRLRLGERVEVICGDAAVVGRAPRHRGAYAAVTCRGLGPPAATLRLAAAFVAPAGLVVVSEPPPGATDRWEPQVLDRLGLVRHPFDDTTVAVFGYRGVAPR